ncbi:MAG: DUF4446 family protein [Thermaerobacter sp.]|nr:DUF4446 family protein [Thermaerobacter sp.]
MGVSGTYLLYGVGVIALVALVAAFGASQATARLRRRLARLMQGSSGSEGLETALAQAMEQVNAATTRLAEMEVRLKAAEEELSYAITRVGMVRFNPFLDTGADLSFSLALLNRRANGLVMTGLWGRDEVRVYAKQITDGASAHVLSQEERQAMELAIRESHHHGDDPPTRKAGGLKASPKR